jgi:hypothetical protein
VVALAGAALLLAGCGSPAGPDRAAVVDGRVIPETSLQQAMAEVNSMDPPLLQAKLTPTGTLTALVQAPVVLHYLDTKGVKVSDSVAKATAAQRGVADPSASTMEIIKLAGAITTAQSKGAITDADAAALTKELQALDVEANPRYGTYDPTTAAVQLQTPAWVTPPTAAP